MGCSCLSLNSLTLAWNKIKEHVVKAGAETALRLFYYINADRVSFHYGTNIYRQTENPGFCHVPHVKIILQHMWKLMFTSSSSSAVERSEPGIKFWTEALWWAQTRTLQQSRRCSPLPQKDDWWSSLLSTKVCHTAKHQLPSSFTAKSTENTSLCIICKWAKSGLDYAPPAATYI